MARLGVLAGGGQLPLLVARAAAARGAIVHIVAIDGEADADFTGFGVTRVNWGQVGRILGTLAGEGGGRAVIAGGVRRPDLRKIRPDFGVISNIPAIWSVLAAGGDDDILSRVIRLLEEHGISIVGVHEVAPELLAGNGPLGATDLTMEARADAATAFALIEAMGRFDVGQAVAVAEGRVLAIEGVEGTDAMLARIAAARPDGMRPRGVLAKAPKPGQELRVDLPAIGPRTVAGAARAGLSGIAVAAQRTLILDRAGTIEAAGAAGLCIVGLDDARQAGAGAPADAPAAMPRFEACGRVGAGRPALAGAALGGALARALAPFGAGHAVVVTGRHVLAVAGNESVSDLVARGAALRRWSLGWPFGRRGIVVLRGEAGLADLGDILREVIALRFAGMAVWHEQAGAIDPRVVAIADAAGIPLMVRAGVPRSSPIARAGSDTQ